MDESVKIEVSGRIDGKIATSIRDIARAAIEADTNLDLLRQSLREINSVEAFRGMASDARTLRNEVRQTQGSVNALGDAVNGLAADFTKASGAARKFGVDAKVAASNVGGISSAANGLRSSLGPLVGLFSTVFAVTQYAQAQDALTGIQNKIRSLTSDMERQAVVQRDLFALANETRTSVEATTDGFVRFSKAMQTATDPEVLRFVETLNKSLISAGRSTSEVNSIVIQLGQALTSGRLMGDEFRSLSENLPRDALQAIADQLGVNVDRLKELSTQGLITTDVLRRAFAEFADEADEAFARSVPTISQALTVLQNQFIAFTEETSGSAGKLAEAIIWVGDNLDLIIPIVASFAGAWLLVGFVGIIANVLALAKAFGLFALAMAPATAQLIAWVAVAAGAIAVAYSLGYAIAASVGKVKEYEQGFIDAGVAAIKFGQDVYNAGKGALGLTEIEAATTKINEQLADVNTQIQTFAGGSAGVIDLGRSVQTVNDALAETGPSATVAAGAVASISGQYNGVLNVAKALEATNGALGAANDNAAITVTRLQSVSGQYNGVMRIASAFNAVAAAAKSAADNVRQLASEQAAASGRGDGHYVSKPGESKGSFSNITGNNSGNSFQTLPAMARGGSGIVGGTGRGIDRNLVAFRANRGERVDVSTKAQQRRAASGNNQVAAPTVINMTIETPNAESFRRSRGQIATDVRASLG